MSVITTTEMNAVTCERILAYWCFLNAKRCVHSTIISIKNQQNQKNFLLAGTKFLYKMVDAFAVKVTC